MTTFDVQNICNNERHCWEYYA